MPKWLLGLLVAIFAAILKRCTPMVNEAIDDMLDTLQKKADQTPNTVDNMLVDFLRDILRPKKDALYND